MNRGISLEFRNLETQVSESLLQPRTVALLSSVFGSLALLLAMVGLYGITSYAVTRRKGEIAIRMALGAPRGSVVRLMLRDVAVLLALGMLAGLAASLAAGRLVTSLLFGVRPRDPVQLAGAVRDSGGGHCGSGVSARTAGGPAGSDGRSAGRIIFARHVTGTEDPNSYCAESATPSPLKSVGIATRRPGCGPC